MNQSQAIAKLRKILGPKFGFRVDKTALDADGRAKASAEVKRLNEKKATVSEAMEARRAELLRDPVYQALRAEHAELDALRSKALHAAHSKRITVGTIGEMFFSVRADGDNWDEVVAKATGSAS